MCLFCSFPVCCFSGTDTAFLAWIQAGLRQQPDFFILSFSESYFLYTSFFHLSIMTIHCKIFFRKNPHKKWTKITFILFVYIFFNIFFFFYLNILSRYLLFYLNIFFQIFFFSLMHIFKNIFFYALNSFQKFRE